MHATWTWAARAHHCKKTQHSPSNEWALTYRPSSSSCDHSNLEHIDRCSQQDSPYKCHRSDTQSPRSSHMGDSLDEIRGHAYKSKALLDWPTENGCFASSASEWIRADTTIGILRQQLTQSTVLARCRCTRNYISRSHECRMQKKCTWRNLTGWSTVAVETDAVHRATNLRAFSIVLAWSWSTEICTTSEEGWPSYRVKQVTDYLWQWVPRRSFLCSRYWCSRRQMMWVWRCIGHGCDTGCLGDKSLNAWLIERV